MLDVFFPAFCLGCGKEGSYCCESCFESIKVDVTNDISLPDRCFLDNLYAVSDYKNNSLLASLIHNFKYEFIKELSMPLGRLILNRLKSMDLQKMVLVPVPLHKSRQKWRGYNQSELLCLEISVGSTIKTCKLLERRHFKKPQMELKKEDREKNVLNAFNVSKIADKTDKDAQIILVDDVATTLSTLNECAKILKQSGFNHVSAIVLARVS